MLFWLGWGIAGALGVLHILHNSPYATHSFKNPYPLIDPARSFISQEDFLVTIQPLRTTLNELADSFTEGRVSIYLEFLNTGANVSIHPENQIFPASLAKLPLALAVMKKIEDGEWHLHNELVLLEGDRDGRSGSKENALSEYPIGTRFSLETLLEALLSESDNTAYYILKRNLHQDDVDQVVNDLGLEDLFSADGHMSAKEYSRFFRTLYTSSFLTREHSSMILSWLDASSYDDFLTHDIGTRVPFPHKYGENIDLNVYSDSGIVYLKDRPYLITVLIEGKPDVSFYENKAHAEDFMRRVASISYEFFSSE